MSPARGRYRASRWLVAGGCDWLAPRIFPRIRAERLLLEYDDPRSGTFEPLAEVPVDKMVVLGLVTTKSPRRETIGELARRIQEASTFVLLKRLALSPQCGFASSINGVADQPQADARVCSRGRQSVASA